MSQYFSQDSSKSIHILYKGVQRNKGIAQLYLLSSIASIYLMSEENTTENKKKRFEDDPMGAAFGAEEPEEEEEEED